MNKLILKYSIILSIILTVIFTFFERSLGFSDNETEFCISGYGLPFIHTISRNRLENYWNISLNFVFFLIISLAIVLILFKLKQSVKNKILLKNFDYISVIFIVLAVNLIYAYKYFLPNNLECHHNYTISDILVEVIFKHVPVSLLVIILLISIYRAFKFVVVKNKFK